LRVNTSIQGTTHEIPGKKLKQENLNKLNEIKPYQVTKEESRKISSDSHLSYPGDKYSVPYKFAGRIARLQIRDNSFSVFVGNEQVAGMRSFLDMGEYRAIRIISKDCFQRS
jgi:hypothetical protein